ncbi:DsbC family protein [Spongiibacter taiwanensis]|uniref:DsbC family protein n=1 Tax=Spongiibacter taiwanensis TaxID=1748242 RepID=UPI002035B373|nr:DsbC family protein [Spongiibacter taiwanensis]USA43633.1 DsbC family protein [Spongiibacter taiwanensis]
MKTKKTTFLRCASGLTLTLALTLTAACSKQASDADADKPAVAAGSSQAAGGDEAAIRQRFKTARPDVVISQVAPSDVAGIYRVELQNGPEIYVSADGKYFFLGDMYSVTETGFVNLAETRRNGERQKLMAEVKREDMIIFSPEGKPKGAVYVFTDVDCGYCQKLHKEVPELNAMGIEVRYLAYPRAGLGTPTYKKMESAWCADDRLAAMDALKDRRPIPEKSCDNPIAEEYKLGGEVGVTGTPAIVTTSGQLIPGYMPADRLAKVVLQSES